MNQPVVPDALHGAAPARFTAEEFIRMAALGAFDDMKVELSHGELVRMTPPANPHGAMQGRLIGMLYVATKGSLALRGEVAVKLGADTVRSLDAALVDESATTGVLEPAEVRLAIEIADTSLDHDLGVKAREYAGAGIGLYWVVDVSARVTHVMRKPRPGGYADREVVRFGEPLVLPDDLGVITLG